jgi:hypothetical protein
LHAKGIACLGQMHQIQSFAIGVGAGVHCQFGMPQGIFRVKEDKSNMNQLRNIVYVCASGVKLSRWLPESGELPHPVCRILDLSEI